MISWETAQQLGIHIPYLRMHHRERSAFFSSTSYCYEHKDRSTYIQRQDSTYKQRHWTHLIGTSTTDFQCFKLTTSFGEQYIEEQYWTSSSALAGHMRDTVPCGAQRWYDVADGQHEQWEGIRRLHCVSVEKLEMLDSVACMCGIQAWSQQWSLQPDLKMDKKRCQNLTR